MIDAGTFDLKNYLKNYSTMGVGKSSVLRLPSITMHRTDPTKVMPTVAGYYKLLEDLEEAEAIMAYDLAKASNDEVIPFDIMMAELELDL